MKRNPNQRATDLLHDIVCRSNCISRKLNLKINKSIGLIVPFGLLYSFLDKKSNNLKIALFYDVNIID
ncbi:MAG: hypothetical protein RJA76_1390 [Bacteroidota bacterium]|jgi:hypothetical protein